MNKVLERLNIFAPTFLKVLDKNGNLVPLNLNTVQDEIYNNLSNRTLILKARQMGVSTLIQAEIYRRLVTQSTSALTLAHNDVTTQLLRDISDRFYKYFPDISDVQALKRTQANARVTKFDELNSRHVIGTAGNSNIGRGGTYNICHFSEVAFWDKAEDIINGAAQGGNPQIIVESTPNGAQGWFYERVMDSLAGRGEWNLIFMPFTKFPEYGGEQWELAKRAELGRFFDQEYPSTVAGCFLTSNTGYFSDITIDYSAPKDAVRDTGHWYSMGIDWGMSGDYTVAVVVDRVTKEMVDSARFNKMSWNLQRLNLMKLYNKWRPEGTRVEENSIGSVNIEEMVKDGMELEKFNTNNSSKSSIFNSLHEELENGLKLQNDEVLISEMNTMISKQTPSGLWSISASGTNHDDFPMALALSMSARRLRSRQIRVW